jgi:hypothetical protein
MANLENFFFARRGRSVGSNEIWLLSECDEAAYRQALGIARGNNVRVRNEYRPRVDTTSFFDRDTVNAMTRR